MQYNNIYIKKNRIIKWINEYKNNLFKSNTKKKDGHSLRHTLNSRNGLVVKKITDSFAALKDWLWSQRWLKNGRLQCLCANVPPMVPWDLACAPQILRSTDEIPPTPFKIDSWYSLNITHVRHFGLRKDQWIGAQIDRRRWSIYRPCYSSWRQ